MTRTPGISLHCSVATELFPRFPPSFHSFNFFFVVFRIDNVIFPSRKAAT